MSWSTQSKALVTVSEAEGDVYLEFSCFFCDPTDVGNLISGSSAFSKSSLNIWKFSVHVLLKTSLENFEHYFASLWNECHCVVVWTFFGIALLWNSNENWPFPVLWPLLSFQICWYIECSTFTGSSFRICDSSAGLPSPPLALFVVILPKARLTSHSRMSGSRWVITSWWLSTSLRPYLYSSSVYSCHLFLLSSASLRSFLLLSFMVPIFAWIVSLLSWKDLLNFPTLLFSLYLFALIISEDFLISLCYSLELCIQIGVSFLFSFAFSFSSQLFVRPPQTTILPFCISFSWDGFDHCPLYSVMNLHPQFFRYSVRSNPLNVFVTI